LKPDGSSRAIRCFCDWGPRFYGISVADNCNTNTNSYTSFIGSSYINDTGLGATTLLTGALNFKVQEIEVFAITG
jgi:hypothetical protein